MINTQNPGLYKVGTEELIK